MRRKNGRLRLWAVAFWLLVWQGGSMALAATTGEDAVTIEDVYEPYLMQLGFLMRTPRGRVCTPAAYEHMRRTPPAPPAGNDHPDQLRFDL